MPEKKVVLAWHFLADGGVARTGEKIEAGYVYSLPRADSPRIIPCTKHGLHGSVHPVDALMYAPGPVLCRVRMWGEVKTHGCPTDKLAARHREVLWMRDISRELRLYACWCVRQVWDRLADERSMQAVVVAERYARGNASKKELIAARDAAWGSVKDGAWNVAKDAALVAARDAAWDAARDAAKDAARDAAKDTAWAAAMDTAWAAARDVQRAEFKRVCMAVWKGRDAYPEVEA
mgnify:CR=1 FL=1